MREIPTDPITNAKDWHVDFGDTVMSPDQSTTGIVDVHSNSDKIASDGTHYKRLVNRDGTGVTPRLYLSLRPCN